MSKSFLETKQASSLIEEGRRLLSAFRAGYTLDYRVTEGAYEAACMSLAMLQTHPNIFRFSPDFASILSSVDLDAPLNKINIPERPILFDLTEKSPFYDKDSHLTALVVYKKEDKIHAFYFGDESHRVLLLDPKAMKESKTIKNLWRDFIDKIVVSSRETPEERQRLERLYHFLFNALLYLESGSPDLREYRPPVKPSTFLGRDRAWRRLNADKSIYPYTLVGFGFKKPPIRTTDQTEVTGHFRWQACGKGWAQVKLVWIDAHVRNYEITGGQITDV